MGEIFALFCWLFSWLESQQFTFLLAAPPLQGWFQPSGHMHWAVSACVIVYLPLIAIKIHVLAGVRPLMMHRAFMNDGHFGQCLSHHQMGWILLPQY